jgi:hypothetical protein
VLGGHDQRQAAGDDEEQHRRGELHRALAGGEAPGAMGLGGEKQALESPVEPTCAAGAAPAGGLRAHPRVYRPMPGEINLTRPLRGRGEAAEERDMSFCLSKDGPLTSARLRRWTLLPLALVLLLGLAGRAEAGTLVSTATDCQTEVIEQPFLRWADPAKYFLAQNGSFTDGANGWGSSGARVVDDNRPGSTYGGGALEIEGGESATSPAVCVGIEDPTIRFFARNTGSLLGTLTVEVLFEDAAGDVRSLPIGVVAGAGGWSPSLPMPIVANLLSVLDGGKTAVAFRFTGAGIGSSWRIDDLYVDPYGK